jgi:GTP-binding protein EngB required for normal cell division
MEGVMQTVQESPNLARSELRSAGCLRATDSLRSALSVLDEIRREFSLATLQPLAESVRHLLDGQGAPDIAVVGRFKAGKSSFLNQLIGRPVIPVDVLPATTVVTEIRPGPRDRVTVRRLGGHMEETSLDSLPEWVTERGNPGNEKQVEAVRVELEGLGEFDPASFIDTPGEGSIFTRASRTRDEWLPHIGAAVVALTADPPFSEDDLALLREVTRFTPEITIILTKVDLLEAEQIQRVEDFVREQLWEHLGCEYPLFPYSTRPGYERLREAVHLHLVTRVVGAADERTAEIARFKLGRLAEETAAYLSLALAGAEAGEKARTELLELIDDEQRSLEQWRREGRVFTTDVKRRARDACAEGFASLGPRVLAALRGDFDRESRAWCSHLARTSEAYQEWAASAFRRELTGVSPGGEEFVRPYRDEASLHLARIVRVFQDRLAGALESALGVRFSGRLFEVTPAPVQAPDVRIDRTFDTPLELIWFLIPMTIFRRPILRRLRSHLAWEVEKNLARLAGQWAENVSGAIDQMAAEAQDFVEEELESIQGMISRADPSQKPKIAAALSRMRGVGLLEMSPESGTPPEPGAPPEPETPEKGAGVERSEAPEEGGRHE